VHYLPSIVAELKLKTDSLEPCLFAGELKPGTPCMILVYVDDLLIAAPKVEDIDRVIDTVGKHVVLRKTGIIKASHSGGGQRKFLGTLLCRQQDETLQAYGLKSASGSAPDITVHLEKENEKELSKIQQHEIPSLLMTDSESSLKLLRNLDTPRRSRHLEIKLDWLKQQVNLNKLQISFRNGVDNPSDLLTKCLATSLFVIHEFFGI